MGGGASPEQVERARFWRKAYFAMSVFVLAVSTLRTWQALDQGRDEQSGLWFLLAILAGISLLAPLTGRAGRVPRERRREDPSTRPPGTAG